MRSAPNRGKFSITSSTTKMTKGEVYNFNNNKVRIIQFDEIEVFYEPWNVHSDEWYYSSIKTMIFLRVATKFFVNNSELLENENKDENGLDRLHPHLPMRLNRFPNLRWEAEPKLDLKSLALNNLQGIETESIVIFPTHQGGRHGKSELIKEGVRNGEKLMEVAYSIQAPFVKEKDSRFIITTLAKVGKNHKYFTGVGMYRMGMKGNIPSYYIGGFNDFAGNTEYENTSNFD